MTESIKFVRQHLLDLDMVQCGSEICAPGHSFGPAVRDHYLVHFALSGKGIFQSKGKIWDLRAGEGFLISPDLATFYQADWGEPWQYIWVGFQGTKAYGWLKRAGLTDDNPVFKAKDDTLRSCLEGMIQAGSMGAGRELRMLGLLHLFLSELVETAQPSGIASDGRDRREAYVQKAIDYFRMNFARPIGVSDAAAHVGLDRSYFSEVFRDAAGQPPRDFLIRLRMEKACAFMKNASLSIADISRSVGYDDPLLFSKMFRKYQGLSPRQFRKAMSKTNDSPASD